MKPIIFSFLAASIGLALLLVVWLGGRAGWFPQPTYFIEIAIITMATSGYLYRILTKMTDPQVFVNVYLLTIAMKLLFFSVLLFVLRFLEPEAITPNALFLLISYIVFTALEVVVLFKRAAQ